MVVRTWKIKLKHNPLLKPIFDKWFNDYKYAYNKCNWLKNNLTEYYSKYDLRDLITPEHVTRHIPWTLDTPKDIRVDAVFENVSNWDAAFTNLQNSNIQHFSMGYMKKRKKKNRYCFGLPGSAIRVVRTNHKYDDRKRITIYPTYTNNYQIHLSERIPECAINIDGKLKSSHKILFNGVDFYLLLSIERDPKEIVGRRRVVSVDPGVRKFGVSWDASDKSYKFGSGLTRRIGYLLKRRNYHQSRGNKREFKKLEIRIRNLQTELHHSTSTFLCKRYNKIIIPKLDVRRLVRKTRSREYRRSILRLGHAKFMEQLKAKAELYKVDVLSEEHGVHEMYSSRICSRCRYINVKSSNEQFTCSKCRLLIDRDENGAKNIYYINRHLV